MCMINTWVNQNLPNIYLGRKSKKGFGNEKGCFRRSYRMICMNNFQPGKCMKSSPALFKASWLRLISS